MNYNYNKNPESNHFIESAINSYNNEDDIENVIENQEENIVVGGKRFTKRRKYMRKTKRHYKNRKSKRRG
jgi:hypothetical protein